MLGNNGEEGMLGAAKKMMGDKGGLLNNEDLKEKAKKMVQDITPDSLDEKAGEVVDKAFDLLKNLTGQK